MSDARQIRALVESVERELAEGPRMDAVKKGARNAITGASMLGAAGVPGMDGEFKRPMSPQEVAQLSPRASPAAAAGEPSEDEGGIPWEETAAVDHISARGQGAIDQRELGQNAMGGDFFGDEDVRNYEAIFGKGSSEDYANFVRRLRSQR